MAEQALLSLRVCDPAAGSGHFLLAAARTLGRELAKIRTGDDEPAPEQMRLAIRDCITHCIYGVDKNPLAVDLCKVALWIEGHAKGKPLTFLDHRIRCGDSLIGVMDLSVLKEGISDDAFKPVLGDDKEVARAIKKRNKQERLSGQKRLPFEAEEEIQELIDDYRLLTELPDDTPEQVRRKAEIYQRIQSQGSKWWEDNTACHMWTAAFFVELTEKSVQEARVPTTDTLHRYLETGSAHGRLIGEVWALAIQHRFFHWPLEFPEVFLPHLREPIANSEQPIETHHSPLATRRSPSSRHSPLATGNSPSSHNSPLTTGHWPFANTGFDVVLGNPPWERIKLQEKEFFSVRAPKIADAPNSAARKKAIAKLKTEAPELWMEWRNYLHTSEAKSNFVRKSGRYPLCGKGDVNTYAVFAELNRSLLSPRGRAGFIVQTSIATGDTTKEFFEDLLVRHSLVSIFDFENRKGIFPAVQGNIRFSLLTIANETIREFQVACQIDDPAVLSASSRRYRLSVEDVCRINPNTMTCPTFFSIYDAEIVKNIYRRIPVLIREAKGGKPEENAWGISFLRMFDMSNDSHLFYTLEQLEAEGWQLKDNVFEKHGKRCVPLYESKLISQFNHRANTFRGIEYRDRFKTHAGTNTVLCESLIDPEFVILPRYWVEEHIVKKRVKSLKWLFGYRRSISAVADARSIVATIMPLVGTGDSIFLIVNRQEHKKSLPIMMLVGLNSFALDYVLRQKASGGNLSFYIAKQLPFPPPSVFFGECEWDSAHNLSNWIIPRALELTYTALDLELFAKDCGYDGPPFRWDKERRFLIRAELDAAFFHLYLGTEREWRENGTPELLEHFPTPRDAVDYIMEAFPIVKRRDEEMHSEYKTKRVILECYDAMAEAMRTGRPYQTILDPPPADPRVAHVSMDILENAVDYFKSIYGETLVSVAHFGSRARGTFRPDSDYDFFVILEDSASRNKSAERSKLVAFDKLRDLPIHNHVIRKYELSGLSNIIILADIKDSGIILYDKGSFLAQQLSKSPRFLRG
ncbi:MAG: nucleotidyltransferase domain-containing protein [Deltaproteobacteria bacterium]|nr:nucleotidyltransferase domain-containing protein [Deltaproteobacteria bacterium]